MVKSENKAKIGVFGGTFDPVHFGHLRTALDVVEYLGLAQLHLIPCSMPPHRKPPIASPALRRTMLELAIKNHPKLVVDDRELLRDGPSYSVDTLVSLRNDYANNPLFLMMGTDAFLSIPTWSRWQQLLELAHIVVMQRPNEALSFTGELARLYDEHQAKAEDIEAPAGKIWLVPVTQMAISATSIRESLQSGRDIRYLLPDAVITLIEQLGLYQNNPEQN